MISHRIWFRDSLCKRIAFFCASNATTSGYLSSDFRCLPPSSIDCVRCSYILLHYAHKSSDKCMTDHLHDVAMAQGKLRTRFFRTLVISVDESSVQAVTQRIKKRPFSIPDLLAFTQGSHTWEIFLN